MKSKLREINSSNLFNQPNIRLYEKAVTAYDFTLPYLLNDESFRLSSIQNKVILLCFWSEEEINSETAVTLLDTFYQAEYFGDIEIVAINCDQEKPKLSLASNKLKNIKLIWDKSSKTKSLYKVNQFPTTILIDQHGFIIDEKAGGPINDWARLTRKINTLDGLDKN